MPVGSIGGSAVKFVGNPRKNILDPVVKRMQNRGKSKDIKLIRLPAADFALERGIDLDQFPELPKLKRYLLPEINRHF